jgi:hypothetical protein
VEDDGNCCRASLRASVRGTDYFTLMRASRVDGPVHRLSVHRIVLIASSGCRRSYRMTFAEEQM